MGPDQGFMYRILGLDRGALFFFFFFFFFFFLKGGRNRRGVEGKGGGKEEESRRYKKLVGRPPCYVLSKFQCEVECVKRVKWLLMCFVFVVNV